MKTNLNRFLTISGLAILSFVSCKEEAKKDTAMVEEEKIPGIVLQNMDTLVNPKDDFYNYVNGTWMKDTKIPEDEAGWGGFNVLRKNTKRCIKHCKKI